jgi:cobalamin biosynthesis Mg chelatase CobN
MENASYVKEQCPHLIFLDEVGRKLGKINLNKLLPRRRQACQELQRCLTKRVRARKTAATNRENFIGDLDEYLQKLENEIGVLGSHPFEQESKQKISEKVQGRFGVTAYRNFISSLPRQQPDTGRRLRHEFDALIKEVPQDHPLARLFRDNFDRFLASPWVPRDTSPVQKLKEGYYQHQELISISDSLNYLEKDRQLLKMRSDVKGFVNTRKAFLKYQTLAELAKTVHPDALNTELRTLELRGEVLNDAYASLPRELVPDLLQQAAEQKTRSVANQLDIDISESVPSILDMTKEMEKRIQVLKAIQEYYTDLKK